MDKEKSVLVTGGAGYIGSHIVLACLDAGYKVVVFDRDEKACNHLTKCLRRYKGLKVFNTDVINKVYLEGVLTNESIGAVIHSDTLPDDYNSSFDPLNHYSEITERGIFLLNTMRKFGVSKFIFTSNSSVYGQQKADKMSVSETDPCKPLGSFGESTLMFETILKKHADANPSFSYASLRVFNASGNDIGIRVSDVNWRKRNSLIPKILASVIDGGKEFPVNGTDLNTADGSPVRDFVHVTDVANAHVTCLENDIKGVYNLSSGRETSVWEVVREVVKLTNSDIEVAHQYKIKTDPTVLVGNSDKFTKVSGWEPSYNLGEILRTAYKSYKKVKKP
jgi:UDP-glucose 4-epimerase